MAASFTLQVDRPYQFQTERRRLTIMCHLLKSLKARILVCCCPIFRHIFFFVCFSICLSNFPVSLTLLFCSYYRFVFVDGLDNRLKEWMDSMSRVDGDKESSLVAGFNTLHSTPAVSGGQGQQTMPNLHTKPISTEEVGARRGSSRVAMPRMSAQRDGVECLCFLLFFFANCIVLFTRATIYFIRTGSGQAATQQDYSVHNESPEDECVDGTAYLSLFLHLWILVSLFVLLFWRQSTSHAGSYASSGGQSSNRGKESYDKVYAATVRRGIRQSKSRAINLSALSILALFVVMIAAPVIFDIRSNQLLSIGHQVELHAERLLDVLLRLSYEFHVSF